MTNSVESVIKSNLLSHSSEMVEQTEQDSARKARWSFAINTGNRDGLSGTSSFDNMLDGAPNQAETKLPKEGTAVIKVAGDVNIFITPLLLEALQRYDLYDFKIQIIIYATIVTKKKIVSIHTINFTRDILFTPRVVTL